ncbi:hypothetical protein C0Q70_04771 [Pomacea canaliculata]|uniref:Peroxisomal leader peptide-processing protease n=1 Tax=Pomacea canaliculata TaxID=400727 RepID=A0A2T7PJB2_POMCA|nr:hypothetical protein C0Q70_04771 [Pomacea canaliculata]
MCEVLAEESPDLWNSNQTGNLHETPSIETAVTSVSTDNQISKDLQHIKWRSDVHSFVSFSASIVDIFKCSAFQSALERLMPDSSWELVDRKGEKQNSDDAVLDDTQNQDMHSLLSYFVLLKLHNWTPYKSKEVVRPAEYCQIGEQVEICSTPFGGFKPEAFLNSYSHGIISNLAGRDNCLILSDARCIPGGEGAPLYTIIHSKRYLTGIVVASLCWKNDEWIGFCISCAIDKILDSLPTDKMSCIHRYIRGLYDLLHAGYMPLFPVTVLLQVGKTWGSGVIIGKKERLVLTCSHVIKDANLFPVEAKIGSDDRLIKTEVIHRQHPLHHQFDLGLVRLSCGEQQLGMQKDVVECAKPTVGMKVFAVGYGVFGAEHNLAPSVTSGVISKVLHFKHIPVMVQTTCAVHPGASGGALVDGLGRLLGIIVCNTRDNSSGASFPHINMSIPVCTVWPIISKFLVTGDSECLQALIVKNKLLDSLWSLGETAASFHSKHYDMKILKLQVSCRDCDKVKTQKVVHLCYKLKKE